MAKRKKTSNYEPSIDTSTSFSGSIKVIIAIAIIFVVFYLLTVLILNKKSTKIETNSSIQYTKILAGTTFNQKSSDYLVFFYDYSSSESSDYADLVSKYRNKDKALTIYTVDLNEGLNKKYISTDSNKDVQNVKDLKINGPTLIRIKDHKNVSYVTSSFSDYLDTTVE